MLSVVVDAEQSCVSWDPLHTGRMSFQQWVLGQEDYDHSRFVFLGQVEPARLLYLI